MNKPSGKTRACTEADARARLRQARGHLTASELMLDDNADVAASDAVLAGIAAADALCCHHLRMRSADGDHARSVELLVRIDRDAAAQLRKLLAMKTRAQYDVASIPVRDARAAHRLASHLVALAENAL